MEIFIVQDVETKTIHYVGTDATMANSFLELPYMPRAELSIWIEGRLVNEAIKKKINEKRS